MPGAQGDVAPGGQPAPHLDITRLSADTGFTPGFDVTTAVADSVGWLVHNPR